MSNEVTVTYTNENKDKGGGPYVVTIEDKWGTEEFKVTGKTIRRGGTFQAVIQKRLDTRFVKMTAKDKQEAGEVK